MRGGKNKEEKKKKKKIRACLVQDFNNILEQVFGAAVKASFPNYLRLSIHQSTGEHKVSMSLLDTKTGFTTPWHCSVALMANGEWISATMSEFKKDPTLEIVYENGRPSYFQQRHRGFIEPIDGDSNQRTSEKLDGSSAQLVSNTEAAVKNSMEKADEKVQFHPSDPASSSLDESKEEKITELAKVLSNYSVKNEKGELINPFFGTKHPLLNPMSVKFSPKAWLETLMSIASRSPERYPKRVAGVAYKNLSVHGFGEPTDYQKTFGNYPFRLFSLVKRLFGMGRRSRIQILKDFDGLVKSGEMLVVLGRPGRQVML